MGSKFLPYINTVTTSEPPRPRRPALCFPTNTPGKPQENQSAGHSGTPLSIILSTICSGRDGQYQVLRSQLPRNHAAQGPGYQWDLLVL